ncbi:class I mannose-6-phosphate isomerase [Gracilibacillus alcaliphilus]|uniref:class I mannose-6-phosphate isomerase n=1 Tax=Gracilibacillus alcaliphilus TaxID=1401441 RepID=UPI00195EA8FC|nr:class I mannose-6-phosphate isomerase [Gracilibacillus alcaliphilus]MBM7678008.1 mannose-6-phosphate isomerase class I [Gracilibacillus alcaliphilus]
MYDAFPKTKVKVKGGCNGYAAIREELQAAEGNLIVIECYPTINEEEILEQLIAPLEPDLIIQASEQFYPAERIKAMIESNLTEDRIFGVISHHQFQDFIDSQQQEILQQKIQAVLASDRTVVIYGVGASLLYPADLLIYVDISRWEIQKRFQSGEYSNWQADNAGEDPLRMIKRGYFFEWRVADRLKQQLFDSIDYFLDTHQPNQPVMLEASAYFQALEQVASQPFRLVPFFDPGVWGGNWMQETFEVEQDQVNLAWSFDGVPEENSLLLTTDKIRMEIPANNLVFYQPAALLGERVYAQFGKEFPIRFNYLDTVGGGNLSLQVHPLEEYVQKTFGMSYTQDESYYIMEAKDQASLYLGVKNGTNKKELIEALQHAASTGERFPDEQYIYQRSVKKHDHYSIPAGTIHSAGADTVVLEISATPNRFTFKLWDWDRLGLDGLPRPVHLNHGEPNIVISRDQDWVEQELCNPFEMIAEQPEWKEERTGLHKTEFIETRRHTFTGKVLHQTHGSVNMLNLVEGEEAIIESIDDGFAPFVVHYGETFIIPESVKQYTIRPYGRSIGKKLMTIKAFVR